MAKQHIALFQPTKYLADRWREAPAYISRSSTQPLPLLASPESTLGDSKHHFFAWATTTPNGSVYVGWYDDRNDPVSTKVQYFVGKSTDGGKHFPIQKPVSDTAFNPCTGFPGCGFFGD
jgi:hypothetical protein